MQYNIVHSIVNLKLEQATAYIYNIVTKAELLLDLEHQSLIYNSLSCKPRVCYFETKDGKCLHVTN